MRSNFGCPAAFIPESIRACSSTTVDALCRATPAYHGGCCPGWTGVALGCSIRLVLLLSSSHLAATCDPGCGRGTCYAPNICRCPTGFALRLEYESHVCRWTGADCNTRMVPFLLHWFIRKLRARRLASRDTARHPTHALARHSLVLDSPVRHVEVAINVRILLIL
jgi:hypothetical protein